MVYTVNMLNAKTIFAKHGLRGEPQPLSGGWTNEVWALENAVLRISRAPDGEKLRREAELARKLPREAGYPRIIAVGAAEDTEYALMERLPGESLDRAWHGLDLPQKLAAARRILDISILINSVNAPAAAEPWYYIADFSAEIARYAEAQVYSRKLSRALFEIADAFHAADCPRFLCHGDLTLANLMYYDGRINGVLDLECAAVAPREIDALCVINETYFTEGAAYRAGLADIIRPLRLNKAVIVGYAAMKAHKHISLDKNNAAEQLARLESLSAGGGYVAEITGA